MQMVAQDVQEVKMTRLWSGWREAGTTLLVNLPIAVDPGAIAQELSRIFGVVVFVATSDPILAKWAEEAAEMISDFMAGEE